MKDLPLDDFVLSCCQAMMPFAWLKTLRSGFVMAMQKLCSTWCMELTDLYKLEMSMCSFGALELGLYLHFKWWINSLKQRCYCKEFCTNADMFM